MPVAETKAESVRADTRVARKACILTIIAVDLI
jgi:hypothetical protein